MEKFIGRKEELASLQELYNKKGFQMAVLFGRRRVGKTTLINKFIETNKCKSVSFVSTEMTEKELLERMGNDVLDSLAPNLSGKLKFDSGWVTKRQIKLFGNIFDIEVYVLAYKSEIEILPVQEDAWVTYIEHENDNLRCFEKMMIEYSNDAESRFIPSSLHFDREGSCALLCDDVKEPDEGIAVCILPEKCVMDQSDYL